MNIFKISIILLYFSINGMAEDPPKTEEKPKAEEKPKIEEKPKTEEPKVKAEEKPKVEEKPQAESASLEKECVSDIQCLAILEGFCEEAKVIAIPRKGAFDKIKERRYERAKRLKITSKADKEKLKEEREKHKACREAEIKALFNGNRLIRASCDENNKCRIK